MSDDSTNILVLGDAIVDSYLDAQSVGISDEAPVAVLDWQQLTRCLGGCLNVAASLSALGCRVECVSLVGDDEAGEFVRQSCAELDYTGVFVSDGRPTIEKTRLMGDAVFLARWDVERTEPISSELRDEILAHIEARLPELNAVVVSDYAKGLINSHLARRLVELCDEQGVALIVDSKPVHLAAFAGAHLIKPNEREAVESVRLLGVDSEALDVGSAGSALAGWLKSPVLVTRGAGGMDLYDAQGSLSGHVDACKVEAVCSVSGAGDVVLATMACGLACGQDPLEAARQAARLTAVAIQRPGTCRIFKGDRP